MFSIVYDNLRWSGHVDILLRKLSLACFDVKIISLGLEVAEFLEHKFL